MKTKYILSIAILALSLGACTNYFDEKVMNDGSIPAVTDVRTGMVYELTDDDYKQIATYPENIEKALALDPVDSTGLAELQNIAKEKSFTETASADMYMPAFLADKFPYLDNGTTLDAFYTMREGKSTRIQSFKSVSSYTLTEEDYRTIWGGRGASYLTEASEAKLPAFLKATFSMATDGKKMVLYYNYRTEEPDTIYPPLPYICTVGELLEAKEKVEHQLTGIVGSVKSTTYGRFYLVDGSDSIYVYGLTDEDGKKVWKDKGIKSGDQITLKGKYAEVNGEPQLIDGVYISHTSAPLTSPRKVQKTNIEEGVKSVIYQLVNGEWSIFDDEQVYVSEVLPQSVYKQLGNTNIEDPEKTIGTYLHSHYQYAQEKQIYLIVYNGPKGLTADEWVFDGIDFILTTGYVTETMSFEVKNNKWIANISTYLQTKFVGEGLGKFTIHHVSLDGLNYIWRFQAAYGATASAYVSGTNHRVEDWLVSPNIRLKKSIQPRLTFDQAVRYGNVTDNPKWLNVMVTNNFTGDVQTTEWKQLEWPAELPDGSNWVFQTSGVFDLSEYNGQTIVLGFRYKTDIEGVDVPSAPTWEIQNLLVAEPQEEAPEE